MANIERTMDTKSGDEFHVSAQLTYPNDEQSRESTDLAPLIHQIAQRDLQNRDTTHKLLQEIERMSKQRSKLTVTIQMIRKKRQQSQNKYKRLQDSIDKFSLATTNEALPKGDRELRSVEFVVKKIYEIVQEEDQSTKAKTSKLTSLYDKLKDVRQQLLRPVASPSPTTGLSSKDFKEEIQRAKRTFNVGVSRHFPPDSLPRDNLFDILYVPKEMLKLSNKITNLQTQCQNMSEKQKKSHDETVRLHNIGLQLSSGQGPLEYWLSTVACQLERMAETRVCVEEARSGLGGAAPIPEREQRLSEQPRPSSTLAQWASDLHDWLLSEVGRGRRLFEILDKAVQNSQTTVSRLKTQLEILGTGLNTNQQTKAEYERENAELEAAFRNPAELKSIILTSSNAASETGSLKSTASSQPESVQRDSMVEMVQKLRKLLDNQEREAQMLKEVTRNLENLLFFPQDDKANSALQLRLEELELQRLALVQKLARARVAAYSSSHEWSSEVLQLEHRIFELRVAKKQQVENLARARSSIHSMDEGAKQAQSQRDQLLHDVEHREALCRRLQLRIQASERRAKDLREEVLEERERTLFYLPATTGPTPGTASPRASQLIGSDLSSVMPTLVAPSDSQIQPKRQRTNRTEVFEQNRPSSVLRESKRKAKNRPIPVLRETKGEAKNRPSSVLRQSKEEAKNRPNSVLRESKGKAKNRPSSLLRESKEKPKNRPISVLRESKGKPKNRPSSILRESKEEARNTPSSRLQESKGEAQNTPSSVLRESKRETRYSSSSMPQESKLEAQNRSSSVPQESKGEASDSCTTLTGPAQPLFNVTLTCPDVRFVVQPKQTDQEQPQK